MTSVRERLAPALDGGLARISVESGRLLFDREYQLFAIGQLADFRDDRHLVPLPQHGV
jgi:hypothetical protein